MQVLDFVYYFICIPTKWLLPSSRKHSHKKVLREVRGLRILDRPESHSNIVRYYSCWIDVAPTDERCKQAPWEEMSTEEAMYVITLKPLVIQINALQNIHAPMSLRLI